MNPLNHKIIKSFKKVQVISKYFIPVTAGIEVNILNTYTFLVKSGWQVTVHSCRDSLTEKNVFQPEEMIEGIKVRRYPWRKFTYWPKIDWQMPQVVALHNFDVFPHGLILLKSLMLKILGQKKFVLILTPHGGYSLDRVWHLFPKWQRVIKKTYHNVLAPCLINHTVDGIRAVSEWEKQEMIKSGIKPELIRVIANGIEDEAYMDVESLASKEIKDQVGQWGKYLIQVGRVYPIKNYETVIRALPRMPKEIKFVIVGPVEINQHPEYVQSLKQLIKDLDLTDRVVFSGVIRGVDKYYAIKKSLMMVHMAEWESFCNVVHEGMSQGKVCIVANNTALPLLIKDGINGYCIETRDDQVLAEKINFVLENKNSQLIKQMCETNRHQGLQESWKNVAEKMDHFYKSLISNPPKDGQVSN